MKVKFLILAIAAMAASSCCAQDAGDYTLRLGFNYNDRSRRDPAFSNKESVPGKFEYWLAATFSVRVQSSLLVSKSPLIGPRTSGRGDAILGATYTFVDNDDTHPLGISLDYQIKFPTAIKGLGTDQTDHQITGTLYKSFAQKRVYTEFDGGTYIAGQKGRSDIVTPQFSLIQIIGLGRMPAKGKFYKWKLLNETDYSPPATGSPTSVVATNQLIRTFSPTWSLRFGPNFAITPYDSRFGFALAIQYKGHFGK